MNKRKRLIFTIVSLCFALTLMVFGVYAASSATFTINSTIQFVVSDVYVTVSGSVTGSSNAATSYSGKSYTGIVGTNARPLSALSPATPWAPGDLVFSSSSPTITYQITITNDGTTPASVAIANLPAQPTGTTRTATYTTNMDGDSSGTVTASFSKTIASTKQIVISYAYTLSDTSSQLTKTSDIFSGVSIVITKAEPVVDTISFTIQGDPYTAESGMTWGEWVESEYNTLGLTISGNQVVNGSGEALYKGLSQVKSSSSIIEDAEYQFN